MNVTGPGWYFVSCPRFGSVPGQTCWYGTPSKSLSVAMQPVIGTKVENAALKQPESSPSSGVSLLARAVAAFSGDRVAVLEVADLVGEGDVVAVRRPRHARVLARGGVHRAERVRRLVTGRRGRLEHDLREAVGRARGHRARLAGRQVVDDRRQAGGAVMDVDDSWSPEFMNRSVAELGVNVPLVTAQRRSRSVRDAGLRDEREVRRLVAGRAQAVVVVQRCRCSGPGAG